MKKFLLVTCFLGATNLFADSSNIFCYNAVFQKDTAYIKLEAVPVLKAFCECENYAALEPTCAIIDFKADGSAWVQESEVENFLKDCLIVLEKATIRKENKEKVNNSSSQANIIWRH